MKKIIYNIQKNHSHRSLAQRILVTSLSSDGLRWTLIILILLLGLYIPLPTHAGPLDLNWTLNPCVDGDYCGNTGVGNIQSQRSSLSNPFQNSRSLVGFQQSQFFDVGTGKWYRQMILDFPTAFGEGFRQEVIVEAHSGGPTATMSDNVASETTGVWGRSAGRVPNVRPQELSLALNNCSSTVLPGGVCGAAQSGNGDDPLAIIYKYNVDVTGTGTTHPKYVKLRQTLIDSEFSQEYLKDSFDKKPKITSTLNNGDLSATTVIDMSVSGYNDLNIEATMINTLNLTGSEPGTRGGNFDMATDAQTANVTAGKFIFVGPGSELHALDGVYFYIDGGGYDVWGVSGAEFRNDAQNGGAFAEGAIWGEIPGWAELQ